MNYTRREFTAKSGKLVLAGTVLATIPMLEGCNVASDIVAWSKVGQASFDAIVLELQANSIVLPAIAQALIADIDAGFTAIEGAAAEYASSNPPPVGSLAKLQEAFKSVVDNLTKFMANVMIPGGNILTLIAGLAQIIFNAIAAFENKLPASTQLVGSSFKLGQQVIPVNPKLVKRGAYKRAFNSTLDAGVKAGLNVPANAFLKLTVREHLHLGG